MSAHSNALAMNVVIRDDVHFLFVNDYICFHRTKVKDYQWHHPVNGSSSCRIDFYNMNDALLFKLANG